MAFQKLSISVNGRHICQADGTPFFYLADTAWCIFHRLNREDALWYLDARAEMGFTTIQAVALSEFDGIREPNVYGRRPFKEGLYAEAIPDTEGEYSYWDHVDFIVDEAAKRGLYIALLPTWGDKFNQCWGKGPEIFNGENAFNYGKWIAERYAERPNIIWIMGGDRLLQNHRHFEVIRRMAAGIRESDGNHLITFHPTGGQSSSTPLHDEDWLDFNMIQSGHTRTGRYNYEMITADYHLSPPKPVIDGEPGYEDHPDDFNPQKGYLDAADVRRFAYMSLFSGACGHTYGDHSVWGMIECLPVKGFGPAHFCMTWRQAIFSPGASQMRHVKNLLLSRNFLASAPHPELIENQHGGMLHIPVLKGPDFIMAYSSSGLPIEFSDKINNSNAWWFNPRTGEAQAIDVEAGQTRYVPPSGGRGNDWVLVLDDANSRYNIPGKCDYAL